MFKVIQHAGGIGGTRAQLRATGHPCSTFVRIGRRCPFLQTLCGKVGISTHVRNACDVNGCTISALPLAALPPCSPFSVLRLGFSPRASKAGSTSKSTLWSSIVCDASEKLSTRGFSHLEISNFTSNCCSCLHLSSWARISEMISARLLP